MRFQSAVLILMMAGGAMAQQGAKPDGEKKVAAPGMHVTEITPATRRFELVFSKDDEVIAGLTEFAEKNHIKTADFTAIGAFGKAVLGFYEPEKRAYKPFPINEEMEIASLTGNIRADRNGKPNVHVHCVVATGDGVAHAGHLLEGHISLTLQLYMNVEEPLPTSASK
ncbi:MAG TPA: PPC domain-containing DNA-binding protein [Bryobacteraceae bacterium]|nr:PPC domain-containing DNA-binding protein [Bryobacteraceae bacterium]